MASTIISEEKSKEINHPDYLYKCKECCEFKPNSEYTPSKKINSKGRAYVTKCKLCRRLYHKNEEVKSRKKKRAPELRKKHRISSIYWSSVTNSKNRNLEHSITREFLNELFDKQNGLCYYTNLPMLKDIRNSDNNNDSVSIDRYDSSKGYIPGNVVLCRWIVNRMKNDIEFDQFLQIVSDIHKNFNK